MNEVKEKMRSLQLLAHLKNDSDILMAILLADEHLKQNPPNVSRANEIIDEALEELEGAL